MVRGVAAFGLDYLCLAFAALDLFAFLDSQCAAGTSTTTSAEAPLLQSAAVAEVLPPLAAVVVIFVAVALTYRHLMSRHVAAAPVAGADNDRRSASGLVMLLLCISVGTLEFIVFGQAVGADGGADHGALSLAALHALPAAATATFFLGMMLIVIAHVRAGGEGGGGAVAGDGPIQAVLLRLVTKIAAGAATALVGLMVMALTLLGAKWIFALFGWLVLVGWCWCWFVMREKHCWLVAEPASRTS